MWRFKTSRIQCFINNMSSLFYVFICVLGCPLWFLGKYNYFCSHLLWKVSIFYLSYICHLRNVTFKFVLCRQLVFYLLIWYEYVQILRCFQTDKFQRSYFTAQLFKCYILYVHSMFLWMQLHVVFFYLLMEVAHIWQNCHVFAWWMWACHYYDFPNEWVLWELQNVWSLFQLLK
jgi:hypothetical protein